MGGNESSCSRRMGETAQEQGVSYVPDDYLVPPSDRPSLCPENGHVPIIDLGGLRRSPERRTMVINDIANACRRFGFFQIINHGISQFVMDEALSAASAYFDLPMEEKKKLMSSDVHKPVRYSTSLRDGVDTIQFCRVFLKHYAHPLEDWIHQWPQNPPNYRKVMGRYCVQTRLVALELMDAITESLGLGRTYISHKMEAGMQVMAVNCYPPCPNPEFALGLPPRSDYSCLTILLQSSPGLQIMDKQDGTWKLVPCISGALQVQVGDHVEVLSNGIYKSVAHRAVLNSENTRISIASLHSLGMDEVMESASELVDEQHPKGYKGSTFREFLNFLSKNDISLGKSFIDTLRMNEH